MINLICKDTYETAKRLAEAVGGTCNSVFVPGKTNIAFGWGFGHSILNSKAITDKFAQLAWLEHCGVNAVNIVDSVIDIEDEFLFDYCIMTMNRNPRDNGILLGRKRSHTQGKDIVVIRGTIGEINELKKKFVKCDYVVDFIDKTREFRVHVLGGRWVSISEKKRDAALPPATGKAKYVWAKRNGYPHFVLSENDPIRPLVGSIAVKAAKALHFDFGAVDVILGEDGKLYVLEVNSAPCLNDRRIALYARYFLEQEEAHNGGQ